MKNTILSCIRQSVFTWRFLLCAVFVVAAVFMASTETVLDVFRSDTQLSYGYHGSFVLSAVTSDTIILCLPIVCALPYAGSYVDDVKTGFIKLYIHRTSQRGYILGKALGCVLSGGLAVAFGLFLALGAAALVFLPKEEPPDAEAVNTYFRELLAVSWLFFLSGGFWALFGMTMSAQMESKYIAYASPFIFYYVLIILHERYFSWLYVVYPKAWINAEEGWVMGQWSIALLLAELIAVTALCFGLSVKRRVREI